MKKIKTTLTIIFLLVSTIVLVTYDKTEACTTAIVGPGASAMGVPMLWKNRDTYTLSNKVIYVSEKPYSYIGLINAKETSGRWVYAGLNSEGFGIMNSVAYNLPKNDKEMQDLEGQVMADALRTCQTVDDFEMYLKNNLGASLGSWANFGVIDSQGHAVIFEVHNNGYEKIDTMDAPKKYLINSNFSRTGEKDKGAGYLRFERTTALFDTLGEQKVSHPFIFQEVARDFGHPLVNHPTLNELEKIPSTQPLWIGTQDCIDRRITSAAVILMGKKPGDTLSHATMWVLLGEPLTSIAVPVWVEAQSTPKPLYEGDEAPICAEAMRVKKIIRPYHAGSKENYMNASRLLNKEKKGFLPQLKQTEKEIFQETAAFLKTKRSPSELADFQNKMAQKALDTLKKISD